MEQENAQQHLLFQPVTPPPLLISTFSLLGSFTGVWNKHTRKVTHEKNITTDKARLNRNTLINVNLCNKMQLQSRDPCKVKIWKLSFQSSLCLLSPSCEMSRGLPALRYKTSEIFSAANTFAETFVIF